MTKYIYHSEKTKTTCEECKKYDGKVFYDLTKIPHLPIHPNCRCWIETVEEPSNKKSCTCTDRLEMLKRNISSLGVFLTDARKRAQNELYENEIFYEQLCKLPEKIDMCYSVLKNEYGKHLPECKNFIEDEFIEASSLKTTVRDLKIGLSRSRARLNDEKIKIQKYFEEAQNLYTEIHILKENANEFSHEENECGILSELKELEEEIKKFCTKIGNYGELAKDLRAARKKFDKISRTGKQLV